MAAPKTYEQFVAGMGPRNQGLSPAAKRKAWAYYQQKNGLVPPAPSAGTPAPGPNVPPPGAGKPVDYSNPSLNAAEMASQDAARNEFGRLMGRDPVTGAALNNAGGEIQRTYDKTMLNYQTQENRAKSDWTQGHADAGRYAAAAGRLRSGATQVDRNKLADVWTRTYDDIKAGRGQAELDKQAGMTTATANWEAANRGIKGQAAERAASDVTTRYQNQVGEDALAQQNGQSGTPAGTVKGPWRARPNLNSAKWDVYQQGGKWYARSK